MLNSPTVANGFLVQEEINSWHAGEVRLEILCSRLEVICYRLVICIESVWNLILSSVATSLQKTLILQLDLVTNWRACTKWFIEEASCKPQYMPMFDTSSINCTQSFVFHIYHCVKYILNIQYVARLIPTDRPTSAPWLIDILHEFIFLKVINIKSKLPHNCFIFLFLQSHGAFQTAVFNSHCINPSIP